MAKLEMYGRGLGLRMAILFTCLMAFVLFGYNQGAIAGVLENEDFRNVVEHPSSAVLGVIVGIYNIGCLAGTAAAFMTSDRLGFRKSMWIAMGLLTIGAIPQACAYSRAQMLASRFIGGIGTGIMTSIVPVYQSELCEARNRGMYVCSQPLSVGVGISGAYWFVYGMSFAPGSVAWRLPIAAQLVFIIIVAILVAGPENDPKVVDDAEGIFRATELDSLRGEYKWSQVLKKDEIQTGRRVLLAYGLQFINQMGGVNIIVSYVTTVLQYNVGLDPKTSLLLGGVIQVMFVIGSFYPTFYSDRLGRKKPMMWGSFGLFICMMMISILLSFKGTPQEKPAGAASVAFFFLFMLIYGASTNCVPWVYGPELLPMHVRTKGNAIGISANWLWNFFVAMIGPTLITDLEWKGYLIFMCMNLAFLPILYLYYPETANLSLEEIDSLFMVKATSHSCSTPSASTSTSSTNDPDTVTTEKKSTVTAQTHAQTQTQAQTQRQTSKKEGGSFPPV
ncbi:hypothetical protein AN3115.2 [Aspergillus nidulans FGSC A4]|uniref:MFS sugar transporter, putative (AFU_orthologue AFUA_5G06720) n=1 Tax=Emericella nidulans (strain FGSC A4 / ATCC 38163 / CBS 112.46 / NRRL 194 / M139) TaxID=227321 RepID=Q5B8L5_EMENI|nr:hypothetical protein [Aspergillus nidulans FGSC A4]EAA63686.1 hypothetical protein AN3115.2 [Aspergillus nidulans FGSC A4]CBF83380.1 TPA: MFS sugar transporter, putative (AFU_orthologue; AFUA_5G06720) [Aspergillus nidulans FGSC A4]|eukprot:XP_660719.1 hypothetical protein AN3115.2 [Aspergillus nidulans FGSC A4]